jgi:acyl phosphate:glycerol-3-phosphate acyltransferase
MAGRDYVDAATVLFAMVCSYLIGCISFGRLVVRLFGGGRALTDMELDVPGSDTKFRYTAVSGTAVGMSMGSRFGCLAGILDMLKAAIPTLLFKLLYPGQPVFLIAGLAAMVGHIWPIFYHFKGGRGYSAVYGSLLVVDVVGAVVTSVVGMVVGIVVVRDLMMAYLLSLWLIIPWLWLTTHDLAYLAYGVGLNIIFMLAFIPELRQVIALRKAGHFDFQNDMRTYPMAREMLQMQDKITDLLSHRRQPKA